MLLTFTTSILDTIYGANMPSSAQGSQKCKLVAFSIDLHYFFYSTMLRLKFKGVVGVRLTTQVSNFSSNFLLIQTLKFLELAIGVWIIEVGLYSILSTKCNV